MYKGCGSPSGCKHLNDSPQEVHKSSYALLRGLDPLIIHRRASTPMYKGFDQSLRCVDP